jgi:biotin operon repressor
MINITSIYLIEGIDNSPYKVYIGKTKKSRKYAHVHTFGPDIKYTIIDSIDSLDRKDWKSLETYWIQQFRAWGFEVVNKNDGGGGPIQHTDITKNKMSISHYGMSHSEDTKNKIRLSHVGIKRPKHIGEKISKSNTGNKKTRIKQRKDKGIPKSETHRYKMSIAKLGKPSTNPTKPILQYDTQGNFIREWSSGTEISKVLGISHGNIVKCCKGFRKHIGGFVWHYK